MMLENGGEDVLLALCAKASCNALDSPVVSFRAAAGEEYLPGETAENFGDLASCIFNGTSCVTSQSVDDMGALRSARFPIPELWRSYRHI